MLKRIICVLLMTLLAGCATETGNQSSSQAQTSKQETAEKADKSTVNESKSTEVDEFTQEKLKKNAAIQDEEGMPYMNPRDFNYTYDGYNPELENPWDIYNLLDNVIILTIDDMKGAKTFIDGDVYSFVNKEGRNTTPARLPVNGQEPDVTHLYVSKTEATEKLKKDDVIALEAVLNQPGGAIQKIVDVNITGEVVHLITRAPQPDEMWGTPRMKEEKQK